MELHQLSAREAVAKLNRREVSPLELVEAAAARIAAVEPAVNALPTLCLDRARDHAKRLMRGESLEALSRERSVSAPRLHTDAEGTATLDPACRCGREDSAGAGQVRGPSQRQRAARAARAPNARADPGRAGGP